MSVLRRCLLAAAVAFACPAAAQETAQTADSQIVVTGKRDLDREVADFVEALTPKAGKDQLGRFETAICPATMGFSANQQRAIVERLRSVARAAKIEVAGPGCRANLVVLAAHDKRALIEMLARRHPQYLGELSSFEIRRLARGPGPAAAWYIAGPPRTADGTDLSTGSYQGKGAGFYVNRGSRAGSRVTAPVRPQMAVAVLVIENQALVGLTTTQIADYAAMRTLLRADPVALAGSATPTILKILDAPMGSDVPVTLTSWDLGMLRAYYASPLNVRAAAQRSAIRRQLGDTIATPAAPD
jgi:hypothetical protein